VKSLLVLEYPALSEVALAIMEYQQMTTEEITPRCYVYGPMTAKAAHAFTEKLSCI
jgi:hypothetical protein